MALTTFLLSVAMYDGETFYTLVNCAHELDAEFVAFAVCAEHESEISSWKVIATDDDALAMWDKYQEVNRLLKELRQAGMTDIPRCV